jgi:hypothetical protein
MRRPDLSLILPLIAVVFGGCGVDETVNPKYEDAAQLAPPPAGAGFQFETEDMAVDAGVEEQDCYFFKVSELAQQGGLDPKKPVNLHQVQVAQRAGSHHMNIFRVRTIKGLGPEAGRIQKNQNGKGECFVSSNWSDWPLVANSQQDGNVDWTFPEGVANELGPDEWLMLQTHYVNATTQKTTSTGKVRVNFWSLPAEQVKEQIGTLFATNQHIRVCQSNRRPTFEQGCHFNSPKPVHVIGTNGHFHSRGTQFDVYAWDGSSVMTPSESARFYTSEAWDEPPMLHSPDLDVTVPSGGGVWYTCAYEWRQPDPSIGCKGLDAVDKAKYGTPDDKLDCCYTFGPIVDKNEHCNAFVYYYPKQDDVSCN